MINEFPFIIYCSDGASRVIKFYSNSLNLQKFKPHKVIYDGDNIRVKNRLSTLFHNDLVIIDVHTLNSIELSKINSYTTDFLLNQMENYNIKFLLCFGKRILKENLINKFPNSLINFHPSLLPAFKGLNAIDKALETDVEFLGDTVHYINREVDGGKIIKQIAMYRKDFSDYEDVLELQFPLLKLVLRDVLKYKLEDEEIISELANRRKPYFLS